MCTEVMLMKKSFRKAVLPVVLLSVVGICIISVFVLTYLKRYSVHINRVLSTYEINKICEEYHYRKLRKCFKKKSGSVRI